MRSFARGLVALVLCLALVMVARASSPSAQASCCATPTFVSGSGNTFVTEHRYSTSGSTYAAAQPYPSNGVGATFDYIPYGPNMTTHVGWTVGNGVYHVWTCQVSPHDCSGSLTVAVNTPCSGCASASRGDGQLWEDGPAHLSGSQWNGKPRGSQWFSAGP